MKKIAVFTGTRAEYGLLYWIIKGLNEHTEIELQLIVGGMHLSPEFGYTIQQIIDDGFPIAEKIEMLLSSDSAVGISKSMGLATISSAEAIERHSPDALVLLGDRFESLAVAQAAMVARVPIIHLHGGEATEGLIDEAVRHSLTKMSQIHFVATEAYRRRVIQLGENPKNVFNSGAPGIDSIHKLELASADDLSRLIDFDLDSRPYFLVTYHPVTLEQEGGVNALREMLYALDDFENYKLIITYPNADTHGRELIKVLDEYQDAHSDRVLLVRSLGQYRYLSLMKYCSAVIGNSSSGLIETPTFNVPTINIGDRQKGRLCGATILQAQEDRVSIKNAIDEALSEQFISVCRDAINPYGDGKASEFIVDKIVNSSLENIIKKPFHDLEFKL